MKRLLLVAYHFPPNPAVGARRPGFLARFLPEFDWEVTVLTRAPAGGDGIGCEVVGAPVVGASLETSLRDALGSSKHAAIGRTDGPLRVGLQRLREAALFPDNTAPWIPGALACGFRLSRRHRFDAVLSTAMPPTAHVIGGAIASMRHVPWLADYRDPWTGNAYVKRSRFRNFAERVLERSLVARAGAVVTVNEPIARQLEALHGRKVHVIPNAFDRDDWDDDLRPPPSSFTFCYTGSMYDGQRSPETFFAAISQLRAQGNPAGQVRALFYGPNVGNVERLAQQFGIGDAVECLGTVPRPDAIAAQRSSSDLLMFLSADPGTDGELGSKILEYCGARRPIVAFGRRESVLRTFIAEHRLGWFASNVEEAIEALKQAHARYLSGQWEVQLPADAFFDGRALARAFAERLDEIA